MSQLILPQSTRALIEKVPVPERHASLQLDRFVVPGDQEQQREALLKVCTVRGDPALFADLTQRRRAWLTGPGIVVWERATNAPLTLHLSRGNALENAGLCLHHSYGFAFLPGSGLKGMARAFAETVVKAPEADIQAVFGNKPGEPKKELQRAGAVVFHDAWPVAWPKLFVDIVNNHHPLYYRGEDAPGDWDDPNPVYFLAIPPNTGFSFALSKRRNDIPDRLLESARTWLNGALTHSGAGAKTAAGYGGFAPLPGPALSAPDRRECSVTLRLITPAFLAGASQKSEDCDLRSATLRGQLRWWWRTLHAGFVDVDTLRRMEAAVWGDTGVGGAVRITVQPVANNPKPEKCPFKKVVAKGGKQILRFDDGFAQKHGIEVDKNNQTQGLVYASYGMDEMDAGALNSREQRWFCAPGTRWTVTCSARPAVFPILNAEGKEIGKKPLSAELILDQARIALWWLCRLGGVGAKCRKGFGSFADIEFSDLECGKWLSQGKRFREACGLPPDNFLPTQVASPSLKQMRELSTALGLTNWVEVGTGSPDPWHALDEIGKAMRNFAQSPAATGHGKHCDAKRHLGLPRKIDKNPGKELKTKRGNRHASPALYHVADGLTIRVCAFPSADTRAEKTAETKGRQESHDMLKKLLEKVKQSLEERAG